jgi:hypothetical protein
VKRALGDDFERVRMALEGLDPDNHARQAFIDADVPATVHHGDANGGNFLVDGLHDNPGTETKSFEHLGVIDVGDMKWSIDEPVYEKTGKVVATKTGANDVARFLESFEIMQTGKLDAGEIAGIRKEFMKVYLKEFATRTKGRAIDPAAFAAAERWYRIAYEVRVVKTDPSAKPRILKLLGMEARR